MRICGKKTCVDCGKPICEKCYIVNDDGMYDWASKANKFLDKLARMARKEEKVVFLCTPKFTEFSKAWLEHRINFRINGYLHCNECDKPICETCYTVNDDGVALCEDCAEKEVIVWKRNH